MAHTETLVHMGEGGGAEQGFSCFFTDGLTITRNLVPSVAQTKLILVSVV